MTASVPSTILVVDDDQDTCRNLSDILSDLGYQVDTANDAESALILIERRPYDVALLDYKMPGMNGLELYRAIKQRRPEMIAIMVSAYTNRATQEAAIGAGAWQVLSKPVDFTRLLGLVDEAVGQPLVMVVDDDPELCRSLWDLLRDHGYRVALAGDTRSAIQQLDERSFRVILLDMRLPDGTGSDVFEAVRTTRPTARTIVITGQLHELDCLVQEVMRGGADAICYKPFDVSQLLATLNSLSRL